MSILVCQLQGRFGNNAMQVLFAKAYAEKHGFTFQCDSWVGQRVFQLDDVRPHNADGWPRYNEAQLATIVPDHSFVFRGYAQMQSCMIYTKRQAQAWLKLKPEIEEACYRNTPSFGGHGDKPIVCHLRRGDYFGYSYPVVAEDSYRAAANEYGLDWDCASVRLSEENPTTHAGLPDDLSFAPDFYRMMKAKTLLRANSSFSWLAGLLGNGLVLSPVIDGLEGGKEHLCRFVPGNWPRLANFDFTTDLHIAQ